MRILLVSPFILAVLGIGVQTAAAERPNVLLICIDDLKPLLGCYGEKTVLSPSIDRLAARGLRFERAYCNQAVCAPSRNALLTGLRPQTLGIYDLGTNFRKAAPDAVTLPQHFKAYGYRTEGLGKIYHIGHGNDDDAASWSMPLWRSHVVRYALPESQAPRGLTREEALFSNVPAGRAQQLPRGAAYEAADVADSMYPDGQIADEAIRRLQRAAKNTQQPFFLAVGFVKPHLPFCAPKKYWDLYERERFAIAERKVPPDGAPEFAPTNWGELRQYSGIPERGDLPEDLQRTLIHGYHAATSYVDAQVGRVLDGLHESGLADNTIIVLWGDHGWHLGDHGMWCKHTNYEQATRIPLIVVAPSVTKAGTTTSVLVESVDIYPTLCELAGLPLPEGLDGRSFDKTLADPTAANREAVIHVYPRRNLLGRAVRTERYRLVEWKQPGAEPETAVFELYDYESDPEETRNLAEDRQEVVAELRAILSHEPEAKPQLRDDTSARQERAKRRRAP
jgi:iduronate 2-sulfatase